MDDSLVPHKGYCFSKVVVPLLGLMLVASVIGRVWWGHYADQQWQAQLDAISARGEPLTWEEMQPPPVKGPNAYDAYLAASEDPGFKTAMRLRVDSTRGVYDPDEPSEAAPHGPSFVPPWMAPPATAPMATAMTGVSTTTDGSDQSRTAPATSPSPAKTGAARVLSLNNGRIGLYDELYSREFRQAHPDAVDHFLHLAESSLRKVRQARDLDFRLPVVGDDFFAAIPNLSCFRTLTRALAVTAMVEHDRGNDRQALQYVDDMLLLAEQVDSGATIIGHSVSLAVIRITCDTLENMVHDLRIGDAPAASRQQVDALIRRFTDTRRSNESIRRSLLGERNMAYPRFDRAAKGAMSITELHTGEEQPPGCGDLLIHMISSPAIRLSGVRDMQYYDALAVASQDRWKHATGAWTPNEDCSRVQGIGYALAMHFWPSMEHYNSIHFRCVGQQRMGAAALAIRLYELDNGHLPADLAELAPRYIQAVPEDPFTLKPGPIGWKLDGRYRVLFVLNQDRKADDGEFACKAAAPGSVDRDTMDLVWFLDGNRGKAEGEVVTRTPLLFPWMPKSSRTARPATPTSQATSATSPAKAAGPQSH